MTDLGLWQWKTVTAAGTRLWAGRSCHLGPRSWTGSALHWEQGVGQQPGARPPRPREHPQAHPSQWLYYGDMEAGRHIFLLHQWQNWGLLRRCDFSESTQTRGCFRLTTANFKRWKWGVSREPLHYLHSFSVNLIFRSTSVFYLFFFNVEDFRSVWSPQPIN